MKLPLYWCPISNFGDALNPEIFEKIGGFEPCYENAHFAAVSGIGSILENFLEISQRPKSAKLPLHVFSSGFHFEAGKSLYHQNVVLPETFCRPMQFWAVRGHLTYQRILQIFGNALPPPRVLGDGGLLADRLLPRTRKAEWRVGIVPHYDEKNQPVFSFLEQSICGARILDITLPPMAFLEELMQCETVLSTAMHPLIVCDSLGIPNMWIRLQNDKIPYYKFADYYSVYGIIPRPFLLQEENMTLLNADYVRRHYVVSGERVMEIKKNLHQCLIQMKKEIAPSLWNYAFQKKQFLCLKRFLKLLSSLVPVQKWRQKIRRWGGDVWRH